MCHHVDFGWKITKLIALERNIPGVITSEFAFFGVICKRKFETLQALKNLIGEEPGTITPELC